MSAAHPSPPLSRLLDLSAELVQAVRSGRSATAWMARCPPDARAGVQALGFDVLRRLGAATEARARMAPKPPPPAVDALLCTALALLWPYTAEWFADDEIDAQATASGIGPAWSSLQAAWRAEVDPVFAEAMLTPLADTPFRSTGKRGVHSEHMGFLLAEMQSLPRAFPGAVW